MLKNELIKVIRGELLINREDINKFTPIILDLITMDNKDFSADIAERYMKQEKQESKPKKKIVFDFRR